MTSSAKTITEYLNELPDERRAVVKQVRTLLKPILPTGLKEQMLYGMIAYVVPLSGYPQGYGGDKTVPLSFVCLAAQKNYYALYLSCMYGDPKLDKQLRDGYKKHNKKLDMGKGCLRFKKIEDLDIETLSSVLQKTSVKDSVKNYEKARAR